LTSPYVANVIARKTRMTWSVAAQRVDLVTVARAGTDDDSTMTTSLDDPTSVTHAVQQIADTL